jgi:glycosyltransferase involved in cell wall biosynthesis
VLSILAGTEDLESNAKCPDPDDMAAIPQAAKYKTCPQASDHCLHCRCLRCKSCASSLEDSRPDRRLTESVRLSWGAVPYRACKLPSVGEERVRRMASESKASDAPVVPEQFASVPGVRVSVIIITFNHEQYITTAVRSVLAQKTSFDFEIIVSEDCSTDSTRSIVVELARNNAERFKLLLSERNLNTNRVVTRAFEIARGEYIALLDGDDFWTAADKLQRQVDFLDRNPSVSLCFHNVTQMYEDRDIAAHPFFVQTPPALTSFDDIIRVNYVPSLSALFRRSAVDPIPAWYELAEYEDWPMWLLCSLKGDLAYMDEIMGTYRVHSGGAWNSLSTRAQHTGGVRFLKQAERGFGPNYATKIQLSRSAKRRQLIEQLDYEKHFWASILQIIRGLWSDRLAYSSKEKLNLSKEIVKRVFVQLG